MKLITTVIVGVAASTMLLLTGCASSVRNPIQQSPENNPSVSAVRDTPEEYSNHLVRWGGLIVSVENKPHESWVEIVARDLNSNGRPRNDNSSAGRFIAVVREFLDPLVYAPNRMITVLGSIDGSTKKLIGEHLYTFPIVDESAHVLWQPVRKAQPMPFPNFWFDPWHNQSHWYRLH